ncbi:MAG: hypothetical protein R3324_14295 [Halobacteriales archaeon]|nr:hypothetical protein [Halobacteriales archaeon]
MTKTIRVSDEYHELLKAHNRDGETMEETLRRVAGGPDPRVVAGILDLDDAERLEAAVERLADREAGSRRRLQRAFEVGESTE